MKSKVNIPKYLVLGFFAVGFGAWLWQSFAPEGKSQSQQVAVTVPTLSAYAAEGEEAFNTVCADCHGANAAGTDKGPPLVHDIYNPGHHSDEAFFLAAKQGVRQHHWPFGHMPAQPQMTDADLAAIVQYVRELQLANGITYRPHTM